MTQTNQNSIIEAATNWWRSIRPSGMTEQEHLENPTAGATTLTDKDLAVKVASYLK